MMRSLMDKYKGFAFMAVVEIASLGLVVGGLVHVVIEVHSIDRRIESSLKENRELGKRLESVVATNRVLLTENQFLLGKILDHLERKP